MKQVVQDVRSGQTQVVDVPVPRAAPGTALIRTGASLVSAGTERTLVEFAGRSLIGKARARPDLVRQTLDKARREGILSTLDAVQSRLDQPMPLGYSSAGTVVEVSAGLVGVRAGDRVAAAGLGCAVHGEYAVVPMNLMAQLPDSVDFESGAFATVGAIALHGFRLAEPQLGDRVAVIGLGLLGLLSVGIARAAGCRVFGVDVDPARVARAREMGVEAVTRQGAEEAAAVFSQGQGFDILLICAHAASADPVDLAGALARDRAAVVAVGAVDLHIPRKPYYEKELRFVVSRSYGPGRYDPRYEEDGVDYPIGYVRWTEQRNLEAFLGLLAEGRLDVRPLITHRFPIERAAEAYDLITGRSGDPYLGVLLTYGQAAAAPIERRVLVSSSAAEPTAAVRLGALGAGSFASGVLFPALRRVRGVEPIGLATASGLKAENLGRRYGFRYATTEEAEILRDPAINTVAVLTRHHLHARQTVAALRAGKHVFCEKPLALSREELVDIGAALTESGRLLCVGFNRRYAPMAVRLREAFAQVHEPLLMHYRVNAGPLPPNHWLLDPAQGGGRIVGEACHFIDFLTFLANAVPVRVEARGLALGRRSPEENVVLVIEFANGSLGTVTYAASGARTFPKERVEVFGGGQAAALDDFRRLEIVAGGRRRTRRAWLRQDKGHRQLWQAFAQAVACGGPPPIPTEHLMAVTLASFAAVESLRAAEPRPVQPLSAPG